MRGDGREAAALDDGDDTTLGLDTTSCLRVVDVGDELPFVGAHLQRERTLRGLRQHHVRLESQADLAGQPESIETARREHDRVEPALAALPQARVDVPAQRLDGERRLEREKLRATSRRRRADAHPRTDRVRAAQRVPRILALEVCPDREALRIARRHVFRRVDSDVDAVLEQGFLELLHEHAARADLAERLRAVLVARGRNGDQRDLDARSAQPRRSELGLREREPTAAAADADQHSARAFASTARRTLRRAGGRGRMRSEPATATADP
jgi:hypothetical protein